MSARKFVRKGFTLVEILIVVVILGILAAVVIPQFTNASESARASSLTSQLQTLRSQLELTQIQHQGYYPDLSTNWNYLTGTTDPFSTSAGVYTAADDDADDVGPYLQKAPINPFAEPGTQTAVGALAANGTGTGAANLAWLYNQSTGQVKAVLPNQKAIDLGLVPTGHAAGAAHPDFITY